MSLGFDANTGRQSSQTWPSGYQASYSYSALGYLQKVQASGAGVPAAQLEILAYDSQGRITSYRQGGKVITGKRYDAATGRLLGTSAQVDGQAEGSLFKQSYAYDSLGNLTNRGDGITGVQESFGYDNLNRLTSYTNLGGGVATPSTVQVVYDARGNIVYKSDVGRYWYDAQRPNRVSNVTLEGYAGAQALSGTRALSYVFDDYGPNAKTVDNVSTGNGNLMYTVSHDSSSGRHTVRWESYTSFNMPLEIKYTNIGQTQYQSNAGQVIAATAQYSCPAGSVQQGQECVTSVLNLPLLTRTCPGGYALSGNACQRTTTAAAQVRYSCPSGQSLSGTRCLRVVSGRNADRWVYTPATVSYSCTAGWVLAGSTCRRTESLAATENYSCAAGSTPVGSGASMRCQAIVRTLATVSYSCPANYERLGANQCRGTGGGLVIGAGDAALATSDRTLSFTYGPEHQRVKQVVNLSNNAPTSMMGGTTWYLHGENNSLLYEKEEKVNGITEQRHYLQAAGMTFALAVTRSGPGLSSQSQDAKQRPTQLSYFLQDHLGSIAAVTDENGNVQERLAYDPWGKRRYADGNPDTHDNIVGLTTDRGFTEHEHLDEVGVIHMNGRVYDPLIGRFMSADPHVTYPYRLQSFNRYAYALNNPLRFVDPSGFDPGDNDGPRDNSYPGLGPESMSDLGRDASDGGFTIGGLNTVALDVSRVANALATELGSAFAMPEQTMVAHDDRLLALGPFGIIFSPVNPAVTAPIVGPAAAPRGLMVLDRPYIEERPQPTLPSFEIKAPPVVQLIVNVAIEAGKRLGIIEATPQKPEGVPEDWQQEPGKKEGHTKWTNPNNPHDYVRVKPDGTVTQVRDGKAYDVNGNRVDLKSPGAHGIAIDDFTFRP